MPRPESARWIEELPEEPQGELPEESPEKEPIEGVPGKRKKKTPEIDPRTTRGVHWASGSTPEDYRAPTKRGTSDDPKTTEGSLLVDQIADSTLNPEELLLMKEAGDEEQDFVGSDSAKLEIAEWKREMDEAKTREAGDKGVDYDEEERDLEISELNKAGRHEEIVKAAEKKFPPKALIKDAWDTGKTDKKVGKPLASKPKNRKKSAYQNIRDFFRKTGT